MIKMIFKIIIYTIILHVLIFDVCKVSSSDLRGYKDQYTRFKRNVSEYYVQVKYASKSTGISKAMIFAIAERESRFNLKKFGKSRAGAVGLMGITKICWRDVKNDPLLKKYSWYDVCTNNYVNVLVGAVYYKKMLLRFGEKKLALMAFNSGPSDKGKLVNKYNNYENIKGRLNKTAKYNKKYKEKSLYTENVLRFFGIYKDIVS